MRGLIIVRDAAIVVALGFAIALVYNAVQPTGIPLVATQPYQIIVPCPVTGKGEVHAIAADQVRWDDPAHDLVVDCRDATAHQQWSPPHARYVPYDFLDPISEEGVMELLRTPAMRVVVVGDGGVPDSGQEMGAELAGQGLRNVHFVQGGAAAVQVHLGVSP